MATTAFWPVKGSLKEVIDYADNPDKTTNQSTWTTISPRYFAMQRRTTRPTSGCSSPA
ncbi:MAG: hypothetical protein IKM84_01095 [Oscillospiraceae bacterium]|nr:hypothetical protein [Oscillospiraceae bacterium]